MMIKLGMKRESKYIYIYFANIMKLIFVNIDIKFVRQSHLAKEKLKVNFSNSNVITTPYVSRSVI